MLATRQLLVVFVAYIYLLVGDLGWCAVGISHRVRSIRHVGYQKGFCECVVLGKGYPGTICPRRAVMFLPPQGEKKI